MENKKNKQNVKLHQTSHNETSAPSPLNHSERQKAPFRERSGRKDFLSAQEYTTQNRGGTILIIGDSKVDKQILARILEKEDIDPKRAEWHLNYKDGKRFDFERLKNNPRYSLIMVGAMPHNGCATNGYGSVISALEKEEGYPPVIRLGSKGLKITKSSFEKGIDEARKQGYV